MVSKSAVLPQLVAALAGVSALIAPAPARADVITATCTQLVKSVARTGFNINFATTSSTPVNIPSAKATIIVPAGQTYCVRIRFSASVKCDSTMVQNHCYVRPTEPNAFFDPPAAAYSSSPEASSNSFEWIALKQEGTHAIQMQAQSDSGISFTFASWTMVVDVLK